MSNHSSNLNLRTETLETLSIAYQGYARAMEESDQSVMAASCYAIAGMYIAIVDQRSAPVLFQKAAHAYRQTNNGYWKILAVCGLDPVFLSEGERTITEGNNPRELYYELLRQYYLYSGDLENSLPSILDYISSLPIFLALPVGRSGVPLQTYVSIIRMATEVLDSRSDKYESALWTNLQVLMEKNEEQFQLMHAHGIHWSNQISVIPFEPDFLATLICLQTQLSKTRALTNFRERMPNRESRVLVAMDIAGEMIDQQRPGLETGRRIARVR